MGGMGGGFASGLGTGQAISQGNIMGAMGGLGGGGQQAPLALAGMPMVPQVSLPQEQESQTPKAMSELMRRMIFMQLLGNM
jgi:hypothetical protein